MLIEYIAAVSPECASPCRENLAENPHECNAQGKLRTSGKQWILNFASAFPHHNCVVYVSLRPPSAARTYTLRVR